MPALPLQNYVDKVGPVVSAAWLNQVDALRLTVFNEASTPEQARAAITSTGPFEVEEGGTGGVDGPTARAGLMADLPLEIINGGTGARSANNAYQTLKPGGDITAAETAAGSTPVNFFYREGEVLRYATAITVDLSAATQLAASAIAAKPNGGTVKFPAGPLTFDSNSPVFPINLGANTTIQGEGDNNTVITLTGTGTILSIFRSVNVGGITIKNLACVGNNQANASVNGIFFYCQMTAGASAQCTKFRVKNCTLSNFKGDYWIFFDNQSNFSMRDFRITGNIFDSLSGNTRDGTNTGVPSACIAFNGSTVNANGSIVDGFVSRNRANCQGMKQFCIHWQTCYDHIVSENVVLNAGLLGISNDSGAYAFLAYDNTHGGFANSGPSDINYRGNIVINPLSCGFYAAGTGQVRYHHNYVTGQIDPVVASIPKGAIVINGATNAEVDNNHIDACLYGIYMVLGNGSDYSASNNKILNTIAGGAGYDITCAAGFTGALCDVQGGQISSANASVTGVGVNSGSTYGAITQLNVKGVSINCSSPINLFSADVTTPSLQYVQLEGNDIDGAIAYGISARGLSNAITRTTIKQNKFLGGGGSSILLSVANSTGVTVISNEFCDYTSGTGYCLETTGAQGRLELNRFVNVTSGHRYVTTGGEELGVDSPTWTGNDNDFVEDLNPTKLVVTIAGASVNYLRVGWRWDVATGWNEAREITV